MRIKQKKKRIQKHNRKLIKKYGTWLISKDWNNKIPKDYDYTYTWADSIPKGWRIAFGKMMLREISDVVKVQGLHDYSIHEIKEKYGELRWYDWNGCRDIDVIINKYTVISRNVCIYCGKPDVPILNRGWIEPICKDCYNKIYPRNNNKYEEVVDVDNSMIAEYYSYSIKYYHSPCADNTSSTIITYNIKDTVDLVRKRWLNKWGKTTRKKEKIREKKSVTTKEN